MKIEKTTILKFKMIEKKSIKLFDRTIGAARFVVILL